MLRVCGVTFDHTLNYGSCFQAYALQTAIERIKVAGEQCDYELIPLTDMPDHPRHHYGLNDLGIVKRFLGGMFLSINLRQFAKFEKSHMKYAKCASLKELPMLNKEKDAFVCGSDVIWNPDENSGLGAFYLDFAEKYKFSYAASFGKASIDDNALEKARLPLSELNSISCREKSSAEIARHLTERDVSVVVDPVVLLDQDEWNAVTAKKEEREKYIFSYTTHQFPGYEEFLKKLESKTGLKTRRAIYTYKPMVALKQGILIFRSPQQWLQQLRDAEYVVTNSFHATAFSVIFHKKFFTVVHGDKAKGINVRMNDFLSELGLQDRIHSSVPGAIDTSGIDYTPVDAIIARKREESLGFLRRNLEAALTQKQTRDVTKQEIQ